MRIRHLLSLVAVATVLATNALAEPITFIHTGSGAGSIDGTSFSTQTFIITATGDTDDRVSLGGGGYFIDHLSASINIATVGTFQFITPTRTFRNAGIVGFSRAGSGGADLFDGPASPAWDMLSSIGPLTGTGTLMQWGNDPVLTDGGVLFFNDFASSATFTAVVGAAVPEPGSLTLLGIGLLAVALQRRRRQA